VITFLIAPKLAKICRGENETALETAQA
jgi:POT family proton-dependent oligopeptide transporter